MAGALSAAVLLVAVLVALGPVLGGPGPSPTPGAPATPGSSPVVAHPVDAGAVEVARTVNRRLADAGRVLSLELESTAFDVPAVQSTLRGMNPQLRLGIDAARRLLDRSLSRATGERLVAFYQDLQARIDASLEASVRNVEAYRTASAAVVARLADLPSLELELASLLVATPPAPTSTATASPTPSPSPSPAPSPSASSSPSPSGPPPTVEPSATWPVPTGGPSASPSPTSSIADSQVVNGGFESTIDPWRLETTGSAAAVGALDPTDPAAGSTSLRVTITEGSSSRAGIAVRQGAMLIVPGSRYLFSVSARSEAIREVRLGVMTLAGATYASKLAVIGPGWSTVTLEFQAMAGDSDAVLTIDLGRDTATTWLDEVAFGILGS